MPTLAYDIDDVPYAGQLTGRALIGRRLSHGVILADPAVSRLHAWVDPTPDGTWAVTDAGSKTGTFVNDQPVTRHDLRDGDVIRVGSTRITFHVAADLPAVAEAVVLTPPPGDHVRTSGVLFDCACGAPIWVGNELIGKRGRCRHCQRQIVVPTPAAVTAPPPRTSTTTPTVDEAPSTHGRRPQCGVCHGAIGVAEELSTCPECDTTYHAECWTENYGCSTYGCGHVDALNPAAPPKPAPAVADPSPADEPLPSDLVADEPAVDVADEDADAPTRMQWEWVTVLAVVLASAVGALLFGLPALVMGVIPAVMLVRRRPHTRVGLLVVAVVLAVVGCLAGLALSDFWYFNAAHLP